MDFKLSQYKRATNNKFTNTFTLKTRLQTRYPMKSSYNSTIPLKIFQTWHTKDLPPRMKNAVEMVKKLNPKFEHFLFDDNECREFIKNNFPEPVLEAFDGLIPGAYKADLWRYCVLYIHGGIYMDIKYIPHNGFKLITLTEREHFVLDADGNAVYNAIMVCRPGNRVLFNAINAIIRNVKIKFYGNNALDPTGPHLLAKFLPMIIRKNLPLKHECHDNQKYITLNGIVVLKMFQNYYQEMHSNECAAHYGVLWPARKIYTE